MGRPPFGKEERRALSSKLISAAQKILIEEGFDSVTTRKIAAAVGMNSANIYRYFKDLDELLMFSLVDLLQEYSSELSSTLSNADSMKIGSDRIYMVVWDVFCKHAFRYPECFSHLFFGKYSERLGDVINSYYEIFPEKLDGIGEDLAEMLKGADIYDRNMGILRKVLGEQIPEESIVMVNNLSISYFHTLLCRKLQDKDEANSDLLRIQMLSTCSFLLNSVRPQMAR